MKAPNIFSFRKTNQNFYKNIAMLKCEQLLLRYVPNTKSNEQNVM